MHNFNLHKPGVASCNRDICIIQRLMQGNGTGLMCGVCGCWPVLWCAVPCCCVNHQVWPNTPQAAKVRPWHGPPLLTDKVVKLLR